MKRKLILCLMVLATLWNATSNAEDEISYGIGTGALTSGLGVNAALRGDNHMGYIAAGCTPGIGYSNEQGWILPCGIGAGWIQTDLLTNANNHHGLGIYVGPVGMSDHKKKNGVRSFIITFLIPYVMMNKSWPDL